MAEEGRGIEGLMEQAAAEYTLRGEHEPDASSPELKQIKRELTIVAPKDFELTQERFAEALREVARQHDEADSVDSLRAAGMDYSGEPEYPTPIYIRMPEIVGTETRDGWDGLVEGIGKPPTTSQARQHTLEQEFGYAKAILAMDHGERSGLFDGIDLSMYRTRGERKFLVDSDGRHRMLTLKGLSQMGCDVTISGMKVSRLQSASITNKGK
jgi:hypothetical protein